MTHVQWHILHSILQHDECGKLQVVKDLLHLPGRPFGGLMDCKLLADRECEALLQAKLLQAVSESGYQYAVTEAGLDGMLRYACGNGEQDWRPAEVIPEDTYA